MNDNSERVYIINEIRNKRRSVYKYERVNAEHITDYVCFFFLDTDNIAVEYAKMIRQPFSDFHTIEFKYAKNINYIAEYNKELRNCINSHYDNGSKWKVDIVLLVSESIMNSDAEIKKLVADCCIKYVVCILDNENSVNDAAYIGNREKTIFTTQDDGGAKSVSLWLLNLIEGNLLLPREDDNHIWWNLLTNKTFDCIEHQMIENTRRNIAGLLNDSDEEKSKFINKIESCLSDNDSLLNTWPISTRGYETICANINEVIVKKPFIFFAKKDVTYSCNLSVRDALCALYGNAFLSYLSNNDNDLYYKQDVDGAFCDLWDKNKASVERTTLKVLVKSVEDNGIINTRIHQLGSDYYEDSKKLSDKLNETIAPSNRTISSIIESMDSFYELFNRLYHKKALIKWFGYVKKQLEDAIVEKRLLEKLNEYENWIVELSSDYGEVSGSYNWDNEVIDDVRAARLDEMCNKEMFAEIGASELARREISSGSIKIININRKYQPIQSVEQAIRSFFNDTNITLKYLDGISDSEISVISLYPMEK